MSSECNEPRHRISHKRKIYSKLVYVGLAQAHPNYVCFSVHLEEQHNSSTKASRSATLRATCDGVSISVAAACVQPDLFLLWVGLSLYQLQVGQVLETICLQLGRVQTDYGMSGLPGGNGVVNAEHEG